VVPEGPALAPAAQGRLQALRAAHPLARRSRTRTRARSATPSASGSTFVDPLYWRDLLAGYVVAKVNVVDPETGEVTDDQVDQWLLNDVDDEEYNRHLAAVHKTRSARAGARSSSWEPRPPGARHDYHDLESYQLAMAHGPAHCFALPRPEQLARQMHEAARTPARPSAAASAPPTAARSSPRDAEIAVRKLWNRITRAGRAAAASA
jgi:hypothetical protein